MTEEEWTEAPPIAPEKGYPAEWYWFWCTHDQRPSIMEVWAGRYLKRLEGLWLPTPVPKPKLKPGEKPKEKPVATHKAAIPVMPKG